MFCSVVLQWDLLVADYNEAKELIEDVRDICDDFESLCQRNLAANTGKRIQEPLHLSSMLIYNY